MRTLIWKEFRLCWPILLVGLALLALPFGFLWSLGELGKNSAEVAEAYSSAAVIGLALQVITLALLGGNAIAGERNDRSSEFLAYLPVSRANNLVSKLVWPVVAAVLAIGVMATIASVSVVLGGGTFEVFRMENARANGMFLGIAIVGGLCFSVAWLGSALLRSPTFAVAGGILAPAVIFFATILIAKFVPPPQVRYPDRVVWSILFFVVPLIACSCFFAGCRIYLRRVEP